ncbi:secreted RxLR effector protein 161-like [Malus domestica]|uniref:secreted RxLR effector protein 161-like n=1 Tax=Malus domestica TaxID=3750 RepID=UPI003974E434
MGDLTTTEPVTYKSAMKELVWHEAMNEEIAALHSQRTWSLVDFPHNKNLVGYKWVFKIKRNSDGTVARLLKDDGEPFNNHSLYRSIVRALQYLVFTRPDIAFSVHQVCQFMQFPMASHYLAMKRILRYLKGTMAHGIQYTKGSLTFRSFSDADWVGDPNDRHSTTGFVVFLGNNPISWASKKKQTVSRSSTEAEYRALSSTVAKLDWL